MSPPLPQVLLAALFDNPAHPLRPAFAGWLELPAFRAFVHQYTTKIRKKLRSAQDEAGLLDIAWELEVAFLLLRERAWTLAYEPTGVGTVRAVDFVATMRGHTQIGVEATRMRQTLREQSHAAEKLGDIVSAKIEQLLAGMPNIIVVRIASDTMVHLDPATAMRLLVQRAERGDQRVARHFANSASFHKFHRRLSAVMLYAAEEPAQIMIWHNPQAQKPLPEDVTKLLRRWQY